MKLKNMFLLLFSSFLFLSSCRSPLELVTYEESIQLTQTPTLPAATPLAAESISTPVVEHKIDLWTADTPMLRGGMDRGHLSGPSINERLDNLARKTVNGRIGQPAEIAHAIYFLADHEQSSFMTGQALVVDGGATARLSTE